MPQRGELRRESSESFESDGLSPEMPLYSPIPTFMPNGVSSNSLTTGCSPRMQWLLLLVSARSMIFAKLSSCHAGRRYMTVGTAASMDGYTAYGASIIKDGKKQSFSCPAPLGFPSLTLISSQTRLGESRQAAMHLLRQSDCRRRLDTCRCGGCRTD